MLLFGTSRGSGPVLYQTVPEFKPEIPLPFGPQKGTAMGEQPILKTLP